MKVKTFDNIKAAIKISFSDWPGEFSTVLFFGGCNFRCPFCINKELSFTPEKRRDLNFEEFVNFWKEYRELGVLKHVVLCGGEPTIYLRIIEFCQFIRNGLNMYIKLDTNGSRPDIIKQLLNEKLVDYIAMDIKAPLDVELYSKCAGVEFVSLDDLSRSMKYIIDSGIKREFRVVKHKLLSSSHINQIKEFIGKLGGDPEEVILVDCKKF